MKDSYKNYLNWLEEIDNAKKEERYEYKNVTRCNRISNSGKRCCAVACRYDGACDIHCNDKFKIYNRK